jgi:hypothetical protein
MSASVLFAGSSISLEQGVELLRAIAPLLLERPIALREAGREVQPDMEGRSACWSGRWVDGDVELIASVSNGDGNPRDGYGYNLSAKLLAPFEGKPWWRAELFGGGWEPTLSSPIRLGLLGVSPTAFDAIRARALEVLPTHRDVTFDDPYAMRSLLQEFERGGHTEWLRTFLAPAPPQPAVDVGSPLRAQGRAPRAGPRDRAHLGDDPPGPDARVGRARRRGR